MYTIYTNLSNTNPQLVGFAEVWVDQPSAKQNYAFCFFFWKKKNIITVVGLLLVECFLGARPQTPWVGFAEFWVDKHSAKQNHAFCFFFWKKKNTTTRVDWLLVECFLGMCQPEVPQKPVLDDKNSNSRLWGG
jgi:hypothetical protein